MRGSAQVAGEVCERLEARGRLTPSDLVDESRAEDAPLHGMFTWDDSKRIDVLWNIITLRGANEVFGDEFLGECVEDFKEILFPKGDTENHV